MKSIGKIAQVLTKVVEIFHWVGTALMAAATVCAGVAPSFLKYFVAFDAKECCGAELSVWGFEITAPVKDGRVDTLFFILFGIGATVMLALMALIFRDLNLIIKRSEGKTPFLPENVRSFREVGLLSILVPMVGTIMSVIARIVLGAEAAEISANLGGLVIGIVILTFTEYFVRGIELERDVDGLV